MAEREAAAKAHLKDAIASAKKAQKKLGESLALIDRAMAEAPTAFSENAKLNEAKASFKLSYDPDNAGSGTIQDGIDAIDEALNPPTL